jgi:sugar phosphate permease
VSSKRTEIDDTPAAAAVSLPREQTVIWVLWLTYGAFYFGRTNISAAVPGLKASPGDGGLGLPPDQIGDILASLKIAYGLGQGLNGQLAEYFSARRLLALGMLGSAALNVLFGLGTGFYFLLFVWACNGYCQSLGWTPCMRVAANWFPVLRRGRAIGLIGTGYQVTLGLTYLVAGWSAQALGWRGALYVPAALLALTAVFMLLFLEEAPGEGPANSPSAEERAAARVGRPGSLVESVLLTLTNPGLWLLGLSLGLLNACRYGFLDWGLTHLKEVQQTGVGQAALNYAVLPVGAVAGSYLAGWATDRFFGGRRAPVICLLLLALAGLTLIYDAAARTSAVGVVLLLAVIGFCIYGPQVLLVGTAPADLARRGTAAAAAGFVNFMGYMGAAAGDKVTGHLLTNRGWQVAIYVWAAWALGAAVTAALLWKASPRAGR